MTKSEGWFIYVSGCEHGPTLLKYMGEGRPTEPPYVDCSGFDGPWERVVLLDDVFCPCNEEPSEFKPIKATIILSIKPREES